MAIVTGSNIGLGLEIAKKLSEKNAHVILACRTPAKAEAAREEIIREFPSSEISVMELDLSSMESVRSFAVSFQEKFNRLDILMCNAGVMAFQERHESVDTYELQLATNHLGHFLLVGLLMKVLERTEGSRVITQSSSANWFGSFNWDDLNAEKKYNRWAQYCMTKLANIMFVNELNKRVKAAGRSYPKGLSVHPGLVIGQLQTNSSGNNQVDMFLYKVFGTLGGTYETGALPAIFACTSQEAEPEKFYGPNGFYGGIFKGNHPAEVAPNKLSANENEMRKLWEVSEEFTKFEYSF